MLQPHSVLRIAFILRTISDLVKMISWNDWKYVFLGLGFSHVAVFCFGKFLTLSYSRKSLYIICNKMYYTVFVEIYTYIYIYFLDAVV